MTSGLSCQYVRFGPFSVLKLTAIHFALCEIIFFSLNIITVDIYYNNWRGWDVPDGRLIRILSRVILEDSPRNSIFDLTFLIAYWKYFWVDIKSIFIGIVGPTQKRLILWIRLTNREKVCFSFQWITKQGKSLYAFMPSVVILIFQWRHLFRVANNASVESVNF